MTHPPISLPPEFFKFAEANHFAPCTHTAFVGVMSLWRWIPAVNQHMLGPWIALNPELFHAINNDEGKGTWAVVDHFRDWLKRYLEIGFHDGPKPLIPVDGRWYLVQRWNVKRTKGHIYLVQHIDSDEYRVVQSCTEKEGPGFRDEILGSWLPAGYDVAVMDV